MSVVFWVLSCTSSSTEQTASIEPEKGAYLVEEEHTPPDVGVVQETLQSVISQLRWQSADPVV